MEAIPKTNFVDRLLAHLDNEIAPIWISQLITLDEAPDESLLRKSVSILIHETQRLQMVWCSDKSSWDWNPLLKERITEVVRIDRTITDHTRAVHDLLDEGIDLSRHIPLRLTLKKISTPQLESSEKWLLAFQLHHTVGDARSLLYLTERFFQHLTGKALPGAQLGTMGMSDQVALKRALLYSPSLLHLFLPKYRILSKRGLNLSRDGDVAERPLLFSLKIPLKEAYLAKSFSRSALFFSGILAGIARIEKDLLQKSSAPIRLRVPIDLRNSFGIGRTLENAVSALAIEIGSKELSKVPSRDWGGIVQDKITHQFKRGVHWATLVECIAASRCVEILALKSTSKEEFSFKKRNATLVTTYVGTVDSYYRDTPYQIRSLRSHTPTFGVNGYTFQKSLHMNFTAFDGVWKPETLQRFAYEILDWFAAEHQLYGEAIH